MNNKKETLFLSPEKRKLVTKIHKWAHLDAQKNPKKFYKLFNEIWKNQFGRRK